jgi:hypothetical protein
VLTVETHRLRQTIEQMTERGNRRVLLTRALFGVTAGLLPAALVRDAAMAFNDLSGCKKKCKRFSGNCKSGCLKCCRKIFRGSKKSCSFGCGKIKPK